MKKKISEFIKKYNVLLTFIFVFLMVFLWLLPQKNLLGGLGDSVSIWQSIVSYYSNKPTSSYVMYKGFISVFPYVWLYQLAKILKTDIFLFIKIFYSVSFSYIVTIGIPLIFKFLFNKNKIKIWRIVILSFSTFLLWKFNYVLNQIVIDLPNLTILVVSICYAITLKQKKTTIINYLFYGFFLGLLLCGSGQYQLSFYLLILFTFINNWYFFNKNKKKIIIYLFLLIIGIVSALSCDYYFYKHSVEPAKKNGEWIPSKQDWFRASLSGRNMLLLKYANGPTINNNNGRTILNSINKNFENQIESGEEPYSPQYFLKIVVSHPVDFITQWMNKLFLAISLDNGNRSVIHLIYFYSLIYVFIQIIFSKIKKISDILKPKALIILSFVLPSITAILFHVEMRYFLSLQILIFSVTILSDDLWKYIKTFTISTKKLFLKNKRKKINIKINYKFITYILFIIVCLSWYASLYEIVGVNLDILFNF